MSLEEASRRRIIELARESLKDLDNAWLSNVQESLDNVARISAKNLETHHTAAFDALMRSQEHWQNIAVPDISAELLKSIDVKGLSKALNAQLGDHLDSWTNIANNLERYASASAADSSAPPAESFDVAHILKVWGPWAGVFLAVYSYLNETFDVDSTLDKASAHLIAANVVMILAMLIHLSKPNE